MPADTLGLHLVSSTSLGSRGSPRRVQVATVLRELEAKCAALADMERNVMRLSTLVPLSSYRLPRIDEELRLLRSALEKESARSAHEGQLREEADERARALQGALSSSSTPPPSLAYSCWQML